MNINHALLLALISAAFQLQATYNISFKNEAGEPVSVDIYWQDNKGRQVADIPAHGVANVHTDNCIDKVMFWRANPKTHTDMKEITTAGGQKRMVPVPTVEFYAEVQEMMGMTEITVLRMMRANQPYTGIKFATISQAVSPNACPTGFIIKSDYSVASTGGFGQKIPVPLTRQGGSSPRPAQNVGGRIMGEVNEDLEKTERAFGF